jgi:hypothetical protein
MDITLFYGLTYFIGQSIKKSSNGGAIASPFFHVRHKAIAANVCPLPAKQVNHSLLGSIFVDVT